MENRTLKKSKKVTNPSNKIQVWLWDEYNQGTILYSCDDSKTALDKAKKHVTDLNLNNSLTFDEQNANWEVFLPVIDENVLYAGNKTNGKHYFYEIEDGSWVKKEFKNLKNLKMFLGSVEQSNKSLKDLFLSKKDKNVNDLDHVDLKNKSVVFFKVI